MLVALRAAYLPSLIRVKRNIMNPSKHEREFSESIRALCHAFAGMDTISLTLLEEDKIDSLPESVTAALSNPVGFPPLSSAIVPGDQIAIALDSKLPALEEISSLLVDAFISMGAGEITLLLDRDLPQGNHDRLLTAISNRARVERHVTERRSEFRYLGPDVSGDPVYLNRWLVDADLVLPVVSQRPVLALRPQLSDLTGIFPTFADAEARQRHHLTVQKDQSENTPQKEISDPVESSDPEAMTGTAEEPAWLLGVQLVLSVASNQAGEIAGIQCCSLESLKSLTSENHPSTTCDFVTAVLDGPDYHQNWGNVAIAAQAAATCVSEGGTIVIWTDLAEENQVEGQATHEDSGSNSDEDFQSWNESEVPFMLLESLSEDYRIIIRSRLPAEEVERSGLGTLETTEELTRLAMAFRKRGLLRCAHLH